MQRKNIRGEINKINLCVAALKKKRKKEKIKLDNRHLIIIRCELMRNQRTIKASLMELYQPKLLMNDSCTS